MKHLQGQGAQLSNPQPALLLDWRLDELIGRIAELGQPAYRARQVWRWVYRELVFDFQQMTDLPQSLRHTLMAAYEITAGHPVELLESREQDTTKALLEMADGEWVECVLMTYEERRTACLSTQAGCPIACPFCATGQAGFRRNLTAGEIVWQALFLARLAVPHSTKEEQPLTNIVYMGMGEPLLNYEATLESIRILSDPAGFGMGARRFTISTAGVVPGILRLAGEPLPIGLAVSLHAADDALRQDLVPLARRYPMNELMQALRTYANATGRRITFEYALFHEVNDSVEGAERLAELLGGLTAHVNLIPANPIEGSPFEPSSRSSVESFAEALQRRGLACTVRVRRGLDVAAGCGQLRGRRVSNHPPEASGQDES